MKPRNYPILLQIAFVVIPLLAGIDKFFHLLVNWNQYLSPVAISILGSGSLIFMKVIGVVEICAGIGMIFRPDIFGYIVGVWLSAITINLLTMGGFYDIALRDFGLALCSFGLARLAARSAARPHADEETTYKSDRSSDKYSRVA